MQKSRRGFSLLELMVVLVIAGILMSMAIRPARRSYSKSRVVSALQVASGKISTARGAAVARSCRSVFHVTIGAVGPAWVTSCKLATIGRGGSTVDTLGAVDSIGSRYGVTVASTVDSLIFDPRGLINSFSGATLKFSMSSPSIIDSFTVNAMGKVIR